MDNTVRFIDLFAGMGGIRLGFEQAFQKAGYKTECVLTSEIKDAAITTYKANFGNDNIVGDITQVSTDVIPQFDFLLAGFPCQAFSVAGKQRGFADTRGTLFFEVERILKEKQPYGFVLENVEGLVTHDKDDPNEKIGRTLRTILHSLDELGYHVTWRVLDAQNFGLAQVRTRIYIVGTKKETISLDAFTVKKAVFGDIMQQGLPTVKSDFVDKLFAHYKPEQLYGKSIKDKRGGENNIHSWEIGIKGDVTETECRLLNVLLKERRKHQWAAEIGIDWMDGMPLTAEQIRTFFDVPELETMLNRLTQMGYLVFEHPKKKVAVTTDARTRVIYERVPDETKPKGYNIVSGKLSFQYSRILNPEATTPTLVAMDVSTIGVIDGSGIRNLTLREGLSLFGYPESYSLEHFNNTAKGIRQGFDLLGNTVCVPVIEAVCERLEKSYTQNITGGVKA